MNDEHNQGQPPESVLSAADRGRLADWDPPAPAWLAARP
jgi:hypothetical protein